VFFEQRHLPGHQAQSDFTSFNELHITINRQPFPHLFYHFCLTYSNWETGGICFSESFEAFAEGLQNALWKLGKVPAEHRTDKSSGGGRQSRQAGRVYCPVYGTAGSLRFAGKPYQSGITE
jgi:hypothetical protein